MYFQILVYVNKHQFEQNRGLKMHFQLLLIRQRIYFNLPKIINLVDFQLAENWKHEEYFYFSLMRPLSGLRSAEETRSTLINKVPCKPAIKCFYIPMPTMFKKEKFLHQINLRNSYRQSYGLPEKQNEVYCCQGTCINKGYTICPEISWYHRTARMEFCSF